jgi:hypothetical protein
VELFAPDGTKVDDRYGSSFAEITATLVQNGTYTIVCKDYGTATGRYQVSLVVIPSTTTPTPTSIRTPSVTPTSSPIPSETATGTPSPTSTLLPIDTPSPTPAASRTATPTAPSSPTSVAAEQPLVRYVKTGQADVHGVAVIPFPECGYAQTFLLVTAHQVTDASGSWRGITQSQISVDLSNPAIPVVTVEDVTGGICVCVIVRGQLGDVNGSGKVEPNDVLILQQNWHLPED